MCHIVHKYLLVYVVLCAIKESSLTSIALDLVKMPCDKSFPCGPPQPRAVKVDHEIPELSGIRIAPLMTVLHRCDASTGCCKETNSSCNVTLWEDLQVKVLITEKKEYQEFTLRNHTLCTCENMKDDPR